MLLNNMSNENLDRLFAKLIHPDFDATHPALICLAKHLFRADFDASHPALARLTAI